VRLQKLVLNNFKPFYGRQMIDFSTEERRPLILIRANNDVGKTTMFDAVKFCLYGAPPRIDTVSYINRTVRKEGEGRTFVTLIFYHGGKHYQITRSIDFSQSNGETVAERVKLDARVEGVPQVLEMINEQNEFIEAILPEDASQFFFFDGENIQKYTKHPPRKHIKDAIEMVLGIRELLNAKEDLDRIQRNLGHELDHLLRKKARQKEAAEEVESLANEVDNLESSINELDGRTKQAEKTLAECDKELSKYSAIREKINQRKQLEQQRDQLLEQINSNKDEQREFNRHLAALLLAPLIRKLSEVREVSIPHWKRVTLSMLLQDPRNVCVCRRPITPKIKEMFEKTLDKAIERSPLQYLGEKTDELFNEAPVDTLEKEFYARIAQLRDFESNLTSVKGAIKKLSEEIGGRKDLDIAATSVEKTRARAVEQIECFEKEKKQKEIQFAVKRREHDREQRKLALEESDIEVTDKREHLESCQACNEAMEAAIDALVEKSKRKVEELASKVFMKLTNAPDLYEGIQITPEYELKIVTKGGAIRPVWDQAPSSGASQVIATSFIAALNRYTAREAPVIIDTPASRLDPIHKANVVRFYPEIASQVIILYHPGELDEKDFRPIENYISSEWLLKRNPENRDATIILRTS